MENKIENADPVKAIASFDKDDFLITSVPYDFLYKFKDDKFKFNQLYHLISDKAKSFKISNFKKLYESYLNTYHKEIKPISSNFTSFDGQSIQLACGKYVCDECVCFDDSRGEIVEVCNHPIMPTERLVNIDDNTEKLKIKYKKGFTWREIIVDKEILASASKIVQLARYGIAVNSENAKHLVKFMTDIENLNFDEIEEKNSVGRLGWIKGRGFSPYVDDLVFDGDESFRGIFNSVKYSGEFDDWLELMLSVRAENNICSKIMLASSFASVLVEPCDCLPFFVHLWGGTESGKTVALMLAASVWASPSLGDYIRTFNSTAVAQELTAGFVNSLPLIYDELQIIKDRNGFDDIVYKLCEGVGRDRGKKSGGVQKLLTWRNCILTTGENPISGSSSGAGAVNRVVEIDCKDKKIFKDPVSVVSKLKNNYGAAGAIFVEWLGDENNLEKAVNLRLDYYKKLNNLSEITDKQAMAASVILTADEIIEKIFFHDNIRISIDDIKPFLITKNEVDQNKRCYNFLIDFIASNYSHFQPNSDDCKHMEIYGDTKSDRTFFIKTKFDEVLKSEGYNPRAFLSWADKQGLILTSKGHNTITHRFSNSGKVCRCVCLIETLKEDDYLLSTNSDLPFT